MKIFIFGMVLLALCGCSWQHKSILENDIHPHATSTEEDGDEDKDCPCCHEHHDNGNHYGDTHDHSCLKGNG